MNSAEPIIIGIVGILTLLLVGAIVWRWRVTKMNVRRMWTTSVHVDVNKRGSGLPEEQRKLAERLRSQVFAVQKHFDLAEHSALILEQMLGTEEGSVGEVVDNTFEAHAFSILRTQLYRLMIVDLWASVLDKDPRTGSVRSILKELRRSDDALNAIRAYYSDPACFSAKVEGEGLDEDKAAKLEAEAIEKSTRENAASIDNQWAKIEKESPILNSVEAKRIIWARHKATAHIERTDTGIVALEDDPPYGDGKMTWNEPIHFFESVRPLVYEVYSLLSATHWDKRHTDISRFYASAFWDRFKNGKTELQPPE